MLVLTVIQGPDRGERFELPPNQPQVIGRSSEALPLSDASISRRHAELTPDAGAWLIRDLGSQHGTFVNGQRVTGPVALRDGDQIRCGRTRMVFGPSGRAPEARPPARAGAPEATPTSGAASHLRLIQRIAALAGECADRQSLLGAVLSMTRSELAASRAAIIAPGPGGAPLVQLCHGPGAAPGPASPLVERALAEAQAGSDTGPLGERLCAPVRARGHTYGALLVERPAQRAGERQRSLELLEAVGVHTALALTDLERAQRQLHAERMAAMGRTVAGLAHSIKNILQGLRGGADLVDLGLRKEDLATARSGWAILQRNLDRIMGLTRNMLAYARPSSPDTELCHVGPLLEDCAQLARPIAQARGVRFALAVEPHTPPVPLDPNLMHQAVMNLVANALEAAPERTGCVELTASFQPADPAGAPAAGPDAMRSGQLWIDVTDNGPGMSHDQVQRLAQLFYTTKGSRGTGLGLAVTRRIVEQHRGALVIDSQPGRGSRFRVVLPISPDAPHDLSQTDDPGHSV